MVIWYVQYTVFDLPAKYNMQKLQATRTRAAIAVIRDGSTAEHVRRTSQPRNPIVLTTGCNRLLGISEIQFAWV